ncbi:pfkB family carbohydrate kinase [Pyrodictium delaneyi]|uniref:PfkB family carbohydrate kinase n=1 Tax=Pyrodictium delaneyi TaxID=1273541 RepID=A0A0P0N4I8_9CREN|nr:PfkB family carbohydrate kinase [Pyrodictium delaneyi]ALL01119.1 pfkB family carbohydrate kinase [Pyrodictium delaneyi]
MRRFILDVFSSPTLDFIDGRLCRGGPAYYANLALQAIGALDFEVRLPYDPCIDTSWYLRTEWCLDNIDSNIMASIRGCVTMFALEEGIDRRRLRLLKRYKIEDVYPGGVAALVSPVLYEYGFDVVTRIASHYSLSILDLQGFARLHDGHNVVSFSELALQFASIADSNRFTSVKASIEDINNMLMLERLLNYSSSSSNTALIITNGPKGVFVTYEDYTFIVKPRPVENMPTGAGDMLATLILYSLWSGYDLDYSVLKAASAVSCILERRDKVSDKGYNLCTNAYTDGHRAKLYRLPGSCHSIDCVISAFE